jgi:hypothetical protein
MQHVSFSSPHKLYNLILGLAEFPVQLKTAYCNRKFGRTAQMLSAVMAARVLSSRFDC